MINETKLKEAVETAKRYSFETKAEELSDTVKDFMLIKDMCIDLAEQVLKVQGFPEDRKCDCFDKCECDFGEIIDFNEALDQYKLIVARDYIHKSKLLDKSEIEEELIYWLDRPDKDSATFSQSIINRQLEKIGEEA